MEMSCLIIMFTTGTPGRSAHTHTSSTSTRRKEFSPTSSNGDDAFIGGFSPRIGQSQPVPLAAPDPGRVAPPPPPPPPPPPASTAAQAQATSERPPSVCQSSTPYVNSGHDSENTPLPTTPRTTQTQIQVPTSVKRYSLVDRPVPSSTTAPSVVVDEGTPPPTAFLPDRDRDRGSQRERERERGDEVVFSVSPEPTVYPPDSDRPMSTSPPPPPRHSTTRPRLRLQ